MDSKYWLTVAGRDQRVKWRLVKVLQGRNQSVCMKIFIELTVTCTVLTRNLKRPRQGQKNKIWSSWGRYFLIFVKETWKEWLLLPGLWMRLFTHWAVLSHLKSQVGIIIPHKNMWTEVIEISEEFAVGPIFIQHVCRISLWGIPLV